MNILSLSAFAPENLVSGDGFGSPVPRQPVHHLHTRAESGAYLRDSSRVPRRRPFIYLKIAIRIIYDDDTYIPVHTLYTHATHKKSPVVRVRSFCCCTSTARARLCSHFSLDSSIIRLL